MKRKLLILIGFMLAITVAVFVIITFNKKASDKDEDTINVVTSFYPVYILTTNLTDQISDINVSSLTDFSKGCLHDYQLTANDMKLLSDADVLIINGGGMEEYMDDVIKSYPNLTVIDLSKNIPMLESLEHEGSNPHVWLDPDLYIMQIENAKQGLKDYINTTSKKNSREISDKIDSNANSYIGKVGEIADEMNQLLNLVKDMAENKNISNKVVIFHDTFAYLAKKAGLSVAYEIEIDEDTPLSAGEIAEVINVIKENNIRYLFTEEQHDDTISDRIEEETGAKVYVIDTAVTGDADKDSYLKSMRNNINLLKQAFEDID